MRVIWVSVVILVFAFISGVSADKCANCGLGEERDPCNCINQVVKAHKIPKPDVLASPDAIKDALKRKSKSEPPPITPSAASYTQVSAPFYSLPVAYPVSYYNSASSVINAAPYSLPFTDLNPTSVYNSKAPTCPYSSLPPKPLPPRKDSFTQINCRENPRSLSSEAIKKRAEDDKDLASLLTLPHGKTVAPKFKPIGDLCHNCNEKAKNGNGVMGVIPAYPGKPMCKFLTPKNEKLKNFAKSSSLPIYLPVPLSPSYPLTTSTYSYPVYAPTYYPASVPSYSASIPTASIPSPLQLYPPASSSYPVSMSYSSTDAQAQPIHTYSSSTLDPISEYSVHASNSYAPAYLPIASNLYSPSKLEKSSKYVAVQDSLSTSLESLFESSRGKIDSKKCEEDKRKEVPFHTRVDVEEGPIPVDPVSIALAYRKLAEQNSKRHISEDKLAFGHYKEPIDGRINKDIHNVDEEKLQTVDRPVVEFKCGCKKGCFCNDPRCNQLRISYEATTTGYQIYTAYPSQPKAEHSPADLWALRFRDSSQERSSSETRCRAVAAAAAAARCNRCRSRRAKKKRYPAASAESQEDSSEETSLADAGLGRLDSRRSDRAARRRCRRRRKYKIAPQLPRSRPYIGGWARLFPRLIVTSFEHFLSYASWLGMKMFGG